MFERMLIGRIENRVTVGLVSFVLIMVFLGWAAINEGGRMQAFQVMAEARSIEQGAMSFAANCTSCHGLDGRGLAGKGPALNNPQFFGHDFFPEVTRQISTLNTEKTLITTERNDAATTDARKAEIDARITEIDSEIATLNADREAQIPDLIAKGYDPARFNRLTNLGWVGTRDSFVLTTLIHGRPVSVNYWPQPMAAWSQTAGGPLRMDQLEDITAYIVNWDKGDEWTLDDLYAVQQFALEPVDGAPLEEQIRILQESGGVLPEKVGTNVQEIVANLAEFTGDPVRGDALYHGGQPSQFGNPLACSGCHIQATNGTGPMTDGTLTRASTERLNESQFAGYTAEQYLIESIVNPAAYIVPGYSNVMLATFGDQLSYQDLADLLAYLETTG